MNINQSQLTQIEQNLITKVLDFPFKVGNTTICLNSISSQVKLELSNANAYNTEENDIQQLYTIKESLEIQVEKTKKDYYALLKDFCSIRDSLSEEELFSEIEGEPYAHAPMEVQDMHSKLNQLEKYCSKLSKTRISVNNTIKSNGIVLTPLLGSFDSNNQIVYLYLNNIKDAANSGRLREYVLIKTFIHEMFHAWNFFACGNKERTVREIDEAMVEFATLYFLYQISITHNEFEPILNWTKRSIRSKQTAFGETAAYGYGYYLNSHVGGNEGNNVLAMLEVYSSKSGNIINSKVVLQVIGMLYPCYPYGKEWDVLMLIYQILFPGIKKKQLVENSRL